jgi:hypothetical protein
MQCLHGQLRSLGRKTQFKQVKFLPWPSDSLEDGGAQFAEVMINMLICWCHHDTHLGCRWMPWTVNFVVHNNTMAGALYIVTWGKGHHHIVQITWNSAIHANCSLQPVDQLIWSKLCSLLWTVDSKLHPPASTIAALLLGHTDRTLSTLDVVHKSFSYV